MKNGILNYQTLACITSFLFLLFAMSGYSQKEPLINLITWGEFDTPTGKADLLDSILANPLYDSIWPVEVNSLPDYQNNGHLEFVLPAITGTLYSFAQQVHYIDEDNFVWRGLFTEKDGDMMIIEEDDMVYGYFFIDTLTYELIDLGNHATILVRYSSIFSDTTVADCAVDYTDLEDFGSTEENISIRGDCEDTKNIRILVFYSERAGRVILPGPKAKMFVEQLNMALENSAIDEDEVHFELAGVHPLPGVWSESSSIGADLHDLRDIVENGVSPSFEDLREESGADVVVLFTNGNYNHCRFTGFAFQDPTGNSESGFALVEGDGGIKYSFAHEVAHTLGCGHSDSHEDPSFARGYYHDHWSTVMVTGGTGKGRIPYYSSPLVEYKGHVTGFANSRDNARQLREGNDGVADNFCFEPSMTAWISGPSKGNESTQYEWCANVLNCNDVDNYHWEISHDGINFTNFANNGTADCISLYLPSGFDLFIRLTVTCSNDDEYTNFRHIFNTETLDHSPIKELNFDLPLFEGKIFGEVTVYPNPANKNVELKFDLQESSQIQLLRTNPTGISEVVFAGYLQQGSQSLIDKSTVNLVGPYYYTLVSEKSHESKIVIYKKD